MGELIVLKHDSFYTKSLLEIGEIRVRASPIAYELLMTFDGYEMADSVHTKSRAKVKGSYSGGETPREARFSTRAYIRHANSKTDNE